MGRMGGGPAPFDVPAGCATGAARRRAEFAEGRAFRVDSGGLEAGQPAERLQTIAAAQPGARHRFPQPLDR